MRIDAHQHFWLLKDRVGAWPPSDLAEIHRDFLPAQLTPLLQQHGVDATVLVQSLPSIADTLFLLDLAQHQPFIQAVVGWVDLKSADVARQIDMLAAYPKLKGLRPMLQDLPDDSWIIDPALAPGIAAMQRHQLSFDALVLPRHLPALLSFAREYPELPIVIDHAAKPRIAGGELVPWQEHMSQLARLPHVYCKLSGLVTEAAPDWQEGDLKPYVDHLLDAFGAQRVIWGSDWPVLNLAADYGCWMTTCESLLAHLDEPSKRQIFGLNAQKFYRLT